MIPARKRWGQHFLIRSEVAEKIVAAARVGSSETAFEVGPGGGALTRPLLARTGRVLAVEIDPRRVEDLRNTLGDSAGRLKVLSGDVLERPFAAWLAEAGWSPPAVLVANLPYNVATPVLVRALEEEGTFSRAVATVQKEVARRFAASPGNPDYGFLSVRAAALARARVLFDLPPGAFRPAPRVTSSVLELTPRPAPAGRDLTAVALSIASAGFRSRRKTLVNAIAAIAPRDPVESALRAIGFDPRARAEELALDDYLELARRLEPAFEPAPARG